MIRQFDKYEGLGNDFVVVDADLWPLEIVTAERAKRLCDRNRGVGADGVLWVGPPAGPDSDAQMVVINADGSRPEMCGNGVRCVVAHLARKGAMPPGGVLRLSTDAGVRAATLKGATAEGADSIVEVDMGMVRVGSSRATLDVSAAPVKAVVVDVGNPHAVVFDTVASGEEMPVVRAAEARHDVWPRGVNVEFVGTRRDGRGLRVRVHERGVGWTQACGTGACAVAAAAVHEGVPGSGAGKPMAIELDGGVLDVTITAAPDGSMRATMSGPARHVYTGHCDDRAFDNAGARG